MADAGTAWTQDRAAEMATEIARTVLHQSKRAHVGHIGSCLSIADVVALLFAGGMAADALDPDRDRLILSKGHAALALYAALHLRGQLSADELDSFCSDGSQLGVHPEHAVVGIDFSTGSLGQGLSIATGAALAARMQESDRRVFAILSDAECNEGSTWEAAMFAGHHGLDNLMAIVDSNGQQALGHTRDVLDTEPLVERWRSFGWDAVEVDGHHQPSLQEALRNATGGGRPHALVARTTFGKRVSYMESQIRWHYMPMSDQEYELALSELDAVDA